MKNILITGVNSYVGNKLAEWLALQPENYTVDKISLRDGTWKEKDLSVYDSIVHVAGIAHRKETKHNLEIYYHINRDLTQELALKAKKEKVHQFIFMSSMSVYGLDKGIVDKATPLNPKSHYGKSKLQAEEGIKELSSDSFKVAIIRPPMIYGQGCKGNYQRLRRLALKTPFFPNVKNKRSMIYIDNLTVFINVLIENCYHGIYCPQNKEYVNTSQLVKVIAISNNKRVVLTKLFNPLIHILNLFSVSSGKVFGNLFYDKELSSFRKGYHVEEFTNSIVKTEERMGENGEY